MLQMTNSNLKYLIAGTGGVGGSIAAFLALAGKNVTCIARGEHLPLYMSMVCGYTPT